jgi:hypothetical protein
MVHGLLSLRSRNSFGNIALGSCLIGLCIAFLLDKNVLLGLGAAVCLLLASVVCLFACLAPHREMADEMSEAHDGRAAGHAFRITLAAVGAMCAVSMATGMQVDFIAASLGFIGLGLLVYGIVFGWLERS